MAQLTEFVSALREGGARANQFEVSITGGPVAFDKTFTFLCKGTSVPAMAVSEVEVPYRGKKIYVSGERTYDTWTITVFSDRDLVMRTAFEEWQSYLHDIGSSTSRTAAGEQPSTYYADALIHQKDRNDRNLRTYKLYDVWPTSVDALEFGFDTEGVMEFGVTFRYNYMTVGPGTSGEGIGTPGTGGSGGNPHT